MNSIVFGVQLAKGDSRRMVIRCAPIARPADGDVPRATARRQVPARQMMALLARPMLEHRQRRVRE
jgi:hypothetical protein